MLPMLPSPSGDMPRAAQSATVRSLTLVGAPDSSELTSEAIAPTRPLRIGVDARFLTHPQLGGFKTYTTGLIEALTSVDRRNQYVLYVDRPVDAEALALFGPNVTVVNVPEVMPIVGMAWREQVSLVRRATQDRLDVFHAPTLSAPLRLPCPLIVTVHDMLWRGHEASLSHHQLSLRRRAMHSYYRRVPAHAVKRAAVIITVSEASKRAILEQLGVEPSRVVVTLEAAGQHFTRVNDADQVAATRARWGLSQEYVLALGSADPRKNLSTLLLAYKGLAPAIRDRVMLALVLAHPRLSSVLHEQAAALGLEHRVKFLENVNDPALASLYSSCSAFVFPSLTEGFGLPLLEAMTCGAPVIAANNSSIPEVTGSAALLFDGPNHVELSQRLAELLTDEPLRRSLSDRGIERAREFSWEKCARETISCYRRVALGDHAGSV